VPFCVAAALRAGDGRGKRMKQRILMIEDEEGLVLTISDRLISEGYEVDSSGDGDERCGQEGEREEGPLEEEARQEACCRESDASSAPRDAQVPQDGRAQVHEGRDRRPLGTVIFIDTSTFVAVLANERVGLKATGVRGEHAVPAEK